MIGHQWVSEQWAAEHPHCDDWTSVGLRAVGR
jgi:hypothetical protein